MEKKIAYISEITVSENKIDLEPDAIVCFVGANGAGKTASLEAIYMRAIGEGESSRASSVSNVQVTVEISDADAKSILAKIPRDSRNGNLQLHGRSLNGRNKTTDELIRSLRQPRHPFFSHLFFNYITAKERLRSVEPAKLFRTLSEPKSHPFHYLYVDSDREEKISALSRRLFGKDCILNPGAGSEITMHVGNRELLPDLPNRDQRWANSVASLPEITTDGAGVQATVGVLCAVLATDYTCSFIDEPDVFLHPPQAHGLGRILVSETTGRQIFLATHNIKFIQGLTENGPERVKIIRLSENAGERTCKVVHNDTFQKAQSDPLLRFTNILDALFHEETFLVENERDALFYSEAMKRLDIFDADVSLNFISVQGKASFGRFAEVATDLHVQPQIIADFDILNTQSRTVLERVLKAVRPSMTDESLRSLCDLDQLIATHSLPDWKTLKGIGIDGLRQCRPAHDKATKLINELSAARIFVVPYGELESLEEPTPLKNDASIRQMIEKVVNSSDLRRAREFLQTIQRA